VTDVLYEQTIGFSTLLSHHCNQQCGWRAYT
jgi:hypothetical protein